MVPKATTAGRGRSVEMERPVGTGAVFSLVCSQAWVVDMVCDLGSDGGGRWLVMTGEVLNRVVD